MVSVIVLMICLHLCIFINSSGLVMGKSRSGIPCLGDRLQLQLIAPFPLASTILKNIISSSLWGTFILWRWYVSLWHKAIHRLMSYGSTRTVWYFDIVIRDYVIKKCLLYKNDVCTGLYDKLIGRFPYIRMKPSQSSRRNLNDWFVRFDFVDE